MISSSQPRPHSQPLRLSRVMREAEAPYHSANETLNNPDIQTRARTFGLVAGAVDILTHPHKYSPGVLKEFHLRYLTRFDQGSEELLKPSRASVNSMTRTAGAIGLQTYLGRLTSVVAIDQLGTTDLDRTYLWRSIRDLQDSDCIHESILPLENSQRERRFEPTEEFVGVLVQHQGWRREVRIQYTAHCLDIGRQEAVDDLVDGGFKARSSYLDELGSE